MFSLTIRTTKMHSWGQQKQNRKQFLYIQMCYLWGVRLCALTDWYVCRHTNSKSKCFKSLNFIMFQFRTMSLSDSEDKGGKTIWVLSFFSSFSTLQFTSSVVKTFKLQGKLGSLRKLKHGHSASLSSRPGYAPSALGLWREGKAWSQRYTI